jgi:hypothetical protein
MSQVCVFACVMARHAHCRMVAEDCDMPPHCDSLDGPVVRAARRALEATDVSLVLPFVPETGDREVTEAFHKVIEARQGGPMAREVADRYFYETVVRLHRGGEGAPFTGLKPAGLDVGPVIPVAEKAIDSGDAAPLEVVLVSAVREQLARRFHHLEHLRGGAHRGVDGARAYVAAMLGLQVWAHGLYTFAQDGGHGPHAHDG